MKYLLPFLLSCFSLHATTYYVATNGNDGWDGTSPTFVSGSTGPWASVGNIYQGGGCTLVGGDTMYILDGYYVHTNDAYATGLTIAYAQASSNSPIVISNYPNAHPVIYGSGPNVDAILVRQSSWVKIFGLTVTNAYRSVEWDTSTNIEFAFCTVSSTTNVPGGAALGVVLSGGVRHSWIHNNTFFSLGAMTNNDQGNNVTIGNFSATLGSPDWTCFNIVESNTFYYGGHAALADYGQTNVTQFNVIHNEPWYYRDDDRQLVGHRVMEQGGAMGMGAWVQYNRLYHAGVTENGGAHGIEMDGPGTSTARFNALLNSDGTGLVIYGGKVGSPMVASWGTNYIYANTIAWNGFGQRFVTNYTDHTTNDNALWLRPMAIANSTNNIFVNNLFYDNFQSDLFFYNNPAVGIGPWLGNMTNYSTGAMFVNTNDGGGFSTTQPNVSLTNNAPAIDAGVFLTTATSSASGTSLPVADAGYFFTGMIACTRTIPGDTIQLQGQTNTATITAISGNTLTLSSSLTWTNGQGVSLAYSGAAPDVGAFEFTSSPAPPVTSTGSGGWWRIMGQ